MKKKLKIICGIGILIAVVFLYAHIEKAHEIYDKDIDPSEYGNVIEEKPVTLRQQFRVQEPTLDGFRIKGVENGDISKVDIIYSLNEVDTGRVVAKGQVNAKEALSARFYELSFNTIKECKGKDFVLSLSQISEDSQSLSLIHI